MYVCIYIYIYICVHAYIHIIYIHTIYIHTYIRIYVYTHTPTHIHIHIHIYSPNGGNGMEAHVLKVKYVTFLNRKYTRADFSERLAGRPGGDRGAGASRPGQKSGEPFDTNV